MVIHLSQHCLSSLTCLPLTQPRCIAPSPATLDPLKVAVAVTSILCSVYQELLDYIPTAVVYLLHVLAPRQPGFGLLPFAYEEAVGIACAFFADAVVVCFDGFADVGFACECVFELHRPSVVVNAICVG